MDLNEIEDEDIIEDNNDDEINELDSVNSIDELDDDAIEELNAKNKITVNADSDSKEYEVNIDNIGDISEAEESDNDYIENNIFAVSNKNIIALINKKKNPKYLTGEDRISRNIMTLYEKVRILGERENQLTLGAKPLIKYNGTPTYREIAEEEFALNKTPFKIIRRLPNGNIEVWKIEELKKPN